MTAKGQRGKTRLLIVDDHPMMRQGLIQLINNEKDLMVCGEAETAEEALAAIDKCKPDLALIDITLGGRSGLELIKDIQATDAKLPLLVLSMHDESLYAERVLRAGGRGYIMKQAGGKEIVLAVRQVLSGQVYVSPQMSAIILESLSGQRSEGRSPVQKLTDREFEIFQLIGRGRGTRQMAEELHLSVKTVEVHRQHIKEKLSISDAPSLVRYAVRWMETQGGS